MLSQEIILALLRWWGPHLIPQWKETGNPTADIQSIRKSSWLCLQNITRVPSLTITFSVPTESSNYCLPSDHFISFLIRLLTARYQPRPAHSQHSSQSGPCDHMSDHVPPSEGQTSVAPISLSIWLLALFPLACPFHLFTWLLPFIPSALYSNVTTNVILVLATV